MTVTQGEVRTPDTNCFKLFDNFIKIKFDLFYAPPDLSGKNVAGVSAIRSNKRTLGAYKEETN